MGYHTCGWWRLRESTEECSETSLAFCVVTFLPRQQSPCQLDSVVQVSWTPDDGGGSDGGIGCWYCVHHGLLCLRPTPSDRSERRGRNHGCCLASIYDRPAAATVASGMAVVDPTQRRFPRVRNWPQIPRAPSASPPTVLC